MHSRAIGRMPCRKRGPKGRMSAVVNTCRSPETPPQETPRFFESATSQIQIVKGLLMLKRVCLQALKLAVSRVHYS